MKSCIKDAKSRGCDAIDRDNIKCPLTRGRWIQLVNYIRILAAEAHAVDLAIGLNNRDDVVGTVIDVMDFESNALCQANSPNPKQYNECKKYEPLIAKVKPGFGIEYVEGTPSAARIKIICQNTVAIAFSTVIKHMSLDKWAVDSSSTKSGSGTRH